MHNLPADAGWPHGYQRRQAHGVSEYSVRIQVKTPAHDDVPARLRV
jgi:hypothetical protein